MFGLLSNMFKFRVDLKMPMRRVEKKPGLNKKQRRARLRFCRKYQAWTEADWLRQAFKKENKCYIRGLGGEGIKWDVTNVF